MPIGAICNREVVIIRKDESVMAAAKLMRDYHVGGVVVVEDREGRVIPVGVLTDRDIVVELIARDVPLDSISVEDVMSSDLLSVSENRGISDALQCMRAKGVRRVIVVDDCGGLVGILSIDDLLEILSDELSDLVRLSKKEQNREREIRG